MGWKCVCYSQEHCLCRQHDWHDHSWLPWRCDRQRLGLCSDLSHHGGVQHLVSPGPERIPQPGPGHPRRLPVLSRRGHWGLLPARIKQRLGGVLERPRDRQKPGSGCDLFLAGSRRSRAVSRWDGVGAFAGRQDAVPLDVTRGFRSAFGCALPRTPKCKRENERKEVGFTNQPKS